MLRTIIPCLLFLLHPQLLVAGEKPSFPEAHRFSLSQPSTVGGVLDELARQTGLTVKTNGVDLSQNVLESFDKLAAWEVIDRVARLTHSRLSVDSSRRSFTLQKLSGKGVAPISGVSGPFYFLAHDLRIHGDLQQGSAEYDLDGEMVWEPGFPVYRISPVQVVAGTDDAGRKLSNRAGQIKMPVDGISANLHIPIQGLQRASQRIADLEAQITVTMAQKMLPFTFADLDKKSVKEEEGVAVTFHSATKEGDAWLVDLSLKYPEGSAVFESFESFWVRRNRIALISPAGKRLSTGEIFEDEHLLRYRFPNLKTNSLQGWKLEYETPSVLKEVVIPFSLKAIPLP